MNSDDGVFTGSRDEDVSCAITVDRHSAARARRLARVARDDVAVGASRHSWLESHRHIVGLREEQILPFKSI